MVSRLVFLLSVEPYLSVKSPKTEPSVSQFIKVVSFLKTLLGLIFRKRNKSKFQKFSLYMLNRIRKTNYCFILRWKTWRLIWILPVTSLYRKVRCDSIQLCTLFFNVYIWLCRVFVAVCRIFYLRHVGSDQGSNASPLRWERRVLTAGPPRKSL